MKHYLLTMSLCLAWLLPTAAHALKSDRDQPAVIDADAVDIDFKTGLRVYYGNVKLRQGTLRLDADKLEVRFKDGELETAIAVGEPAEFRQRPDGKDEDVVGNAQFIHLDEVNNIITLTREAVLTQGQDSVAGKTIVYNMATDKMQVRSGEEAPTRTTKNPEQTGEAPASPQPQPSAPEATAPATTETGADGEPRRPRIILKPKDAE
jgi:lipopolysaccharide export system protein LptA